MAEANTLLPCPVMAKTGDGSTSHGRVVGNRPGILYIGRPDGDPRGTSGSHHPGGLDNARGPGEGRLHT